MLKIMGDACATSPELRQMMIELMMIGHYREQRNCAMRIARFGYGTLPVPASVRRRETKIARAFNRFAVQRAAYASRLLARLRALIRRAAGQASPVLRCGDLQLDTRSGRVTLGGQAITLTSHEFKVLDYLMHRPGAVVSRAELTEHIYAQDFDRDSNTIEVFVGRLRKKLPSGLIETVRGLGYRLVAA